MEGKPTGLGRGWDARPRERCVEENSRISGLKNLPITELGGILEQEQSWILFVLGDGVRDAEKHEFSFGDVGTVGGKLPRVLVPNAARPLLPP